VVGVEVLAQAGLDLRQRLGPRARADQAAREAVYFRGQCVIGARHPHEVRQLLLQGRVALAQHFHLPLDQRHRRTAAWMLQPQAREAAADGDRKGRDAAGDTG